MGAKEEAIASGLIGLSTGWLKGRNDFQDNQLKRQQLDEELAWKREQRQAERNRIAQDGELRLSLANAARPAQVSTGYQVTDDAGSNAFTKDADAAAMMGDMVADQRPSLAGATRVQETAYRDPRQAQAAQAQYNSAPATLDRMGLAAIPYDPAKGLGLRDQASTARKAMTEEQKKMQAEIDDRFNSEIASIAFSGPKWWEAAADALTKSDAPAFKGMKGKAELSEDGKTVTFKAILPDGTEKTASTFEASEKGAQDWAQSSARLDAKTKLSWLADRAKQLREEEKAGRPGNAPSGYQWGQDGKTLSYVPGGPADPATKPDKAAGNSTLERMLLSDQRNNAESQERAALKEASDLEKQISEDRDLRMAMSQGKDSKHWPRLQEKQAEIQAAKQAASESASKKKEYSQMLEEMTREVVGNRASKGAEKPPASAGLSSVSAPSGNRSLASTDAEKGRYAILQRELEKATADGRKQDAIAIQNELSRLPKSTAAVGLSAVQQPARQSAGQPVRVATKSERDALPAGTQYIDPNGQIFVKK